MYVFLYFRDKTKCPSNNFYLEAFVGMIIYVKKLILFLGTQIPKYFEKSNAMFHLTP